MFDLFQSKRLVDGEKKKIEINNKNSCSKVQHTSNSYQPYNVGTL